MNKFVRRIRELSDDELDTWEASLRTELSKTRAVTELGGSFQDTSRAKNLRRNIARILTVKNERRNL